MGGGVTSCTPDPLAQSDFNIVPHHVTPPPPDGTDSNISPIGDHEGSELTADMGGHDGWGLTADTGG